jgi:hypothetical protein
MWNRKSLIRVLIPRISKILEKWDSKKYTNVDLAFPMMIEILLSRQTLFNLLPDLSKTLLGAQQSTMGLIGLDLQPRYASEKRKKNQI